MIRAGTRARRGTTRGSRVGSRGRHGRRRTAGLALAAVVAAVLPTGSWVGSGADAAGAAVTAPVRSATAWHHYDAGTVVQQTCSELVCVHHAVEGPDAASAAWARATLAHVTTAWDVLVERLGFPAPAASAASDGDPRFHVYLADLGPQYFGMAVLGDPAPGHARQVRSHLVVDNDMAGFPGDSADNLAATVAHEFFHAIGVNMDLSADLWFAEASATWAETQVFPNSQVHRSYLREGQLGRRSVPLDHAESGYGNFLLLERLTRLAGPSAVRQVWERLGAAGSQEYALTALQGVLSSRGTKWSKFYADYAMANAFPRQHYPARLRGAAAAPEFSVTLGRKSSTRSQARRMQHLTARTAAIRLSSSLKKARVAVSVKSSKPQHTAATLVVVRRDGSLRKVPMRFNSSGTARTTLTYTRSKVARLVLVTANTSLAFRSCGSATGWSCDGVPVHDRTRVEIRTRTL